MPIAIANMKFLAICLIVLYEVIDAWRASTFYVRSRSSSNRIRTNNVGIRMMDSSSSSFMFTGGEEETETDENPLYKEPVIYFDPAAPIMVANTATRPLPLFLLEMPFYPQGVSFLNIFEMKYRTMMFDIAKTDDMFGYIHCDYSTGRLASVGTLCRVVERNLLEDGRQQISLGGIGRFRINKIITTLPYMQAEVETDIQDDDVSDEAAADKLEKDVYNYLKYYLRIFRYYNPDRDVRVSPGVHKYRPRYTILQDAANAQRRSNFSFAMSNVIQMVNPYEAQLLLQTTNVMKRLKAEKDILAAAAEYISDNLIESGKLTSEKRNEIRIRSFIEMDDDDLQPVNSDDYGSEDGKEEVDEWDISNIN